MEEATALAPEKELVSNQELAVRRLRAEKAHAIIQQLKTKFNGLESVIITREKIVYPMPMKVADVVIPEELGIAMLNREKGAAARSRKLITQAFKERTRRQEILTMCSELAKYVNDGFQLVVRPNEASLSSVLVRSRV